MTEPPPPPDARVVNHPRDAVCQDAATDLVAFINDWKNRHQLSATEGLYIFYALSGRTLQAMCVAEREGLNRRPGGGA